MDYEIESDYIHYLRRFKKKYNMKILGRVIIENISFAYTNSKLTRKIYVYNIYINASINR